MRSGRATGFGRDVAAPFSGAARLQRFELSPIKEVELRASRIPGVVSLAQGIPSFDTPEPIKRFVAEKIADGSCARYSVTPGLPQLREAIADALQRDGMSYDPDAEIIVTVGSIEAIAATLLAEIDPGDPVLVVSPTYASYLPAIHIAGGEPRFVPLNEDANFDLDPDAIAAAARQAKALLLCNPNNPTGTVFSRQQTLRVLEIARHYDLLVITDEVYKDFVYGGEGIFSAAMEPAGRERVVRVCSFSKAYGMTGWRVGFLHGTADRVAQILKVHDALVTCAPVVSQYAALAALETGDTVVAEFRAEFRRRRDRVIARLDDLPHVFDYQKPNASYFAFPRVKDTIRHARDSRRLAAELLAKAKVAVVPGVAFGPTGESHLRLCYARAEADIELAFDRMADFFAGRSTRGERQVDSLAAPPRMPPAAAKAAHPLRDVGVAFLRECARRRLARQHPKIVVVTGTQGTTVMKRTLKELLGRRFRVQANPLSHNTAIGLPLAVLGCDVDSTRPLQLARLFGQALWAGYVNGDAPDVMILELGVRQAGDMRAHLEIVQPDVAIVTPLVPSYSEDHDALAILHREIAALCSSRRADGSPTLLLCGDDAALVDLASQTKGARLFAMRDVEGDNGRLTIRADGRPLAVDRDAVGASSRRALAATVRVGQLFGMSDDDIQAFLSDALH
jgi:aminotransferase